jgi:hypothetical protein
MGDAQWEHRPPPVGHPDTSPIGAWEPAGPADLTAHRLQLAASLRSEEPPDGAGENAIERLLLAFEELVSNGLRHGSPPVRAAVTAIGASWLLSVSDAAPDRPPALAVGRDAAQGGLGLHLVARLGRAHGWIREGTRKTVWARLDHRPADEPSAGDAVPRLRTEGSGEISRH